MAENGTGKRIAVLLGSVRPGNYTSMAAALAVNELEARGVPVDLIDPAGLALAPPGVNLETPDARRLRETVGRATGVLLVTPEYHGTFSSVIKLQIENLGFPSGLRGKPVGLLGVAAGAIGAIKALEHLRSVCSHIGGIVLPAPISIAHVQKVFDAGGRCLDPVAEKQIRSLAVNLLDYIDRAICPGIALEQILRDRAQPGPAA